MNAARRQLTLAEWDQHYAELVTGGWREPAYGGPLSRHLESERDFRLRRLLFDSSAAALRLWNFLLAENQRLRAARAQGDRLVGAMKDLGTVPVLAFALPRLRACYPDGAWWTPCLMEWSLWLSAVVNRSRPWSSPASPAPAMVRGKGRCLVS